MKRAWILSILVAILFLQFLLWKPFLGIPLSADEGVYAVIGQGILRGKLPYSDFFDHKPPGTYYLFASAFKFFGDSQSTIRFLALCFSLLSTLTIFAIGNRLWGKGGGILSALLYALFSGGPYIQGASANTETFMVLPMLLALGCFLSPGERKKMLFLAGFFSGLAIIFKPVAGLNFLVLLGFVIFGERSLPGESSVFKKLFYLVLGFLILPVVAIVYFWSKDILSDFFFQVVTMNNLYFSTSPVPIFFFDPRYGIAEIYRIGLWENSVLWLLGFSGLLYILIRERNRRHLLLACWAIFSFMGVALGRNFFPHYFIQLLPALALLSAYALLRWREEKPGLFGHALLSLVIGFLLVVILFHHLGFYLDFTPEKVSEKMYNTHEYNLAYRVAKGLSKKFKSQERLWVWNRAPQIYFYTKTEPITPFIYYLGWLDETPWAMAWKRNILEKIQAARPEFAVWAPSPISFPGLRDFIRNNYKLIKKEKNWEIWQWQR